LMDRERFVEHAWRCLFTAGICDVRVAAALARYAFEIAASVAELRCPACGKPVRNIHGLRSHVKNSKRCRTSIISALHKAYDGYVNDTWLSTAPAAELAAWLANHGAIPKWWTTQFRRGFRSALSLRTKWV